MCIRDRPYDGKLSRTVLRRKGGGNTADPADYTALVQKFEGQVIKIRPSSTLYINPMDINANYSEEDNPIAQVLFVTSPLVRALSSGPFAKNQSLE